MKFTKNKFMSLIATFVVLAMYNVAAFVIPFEKTGGFWTGWSFSIFAILMTAAVGLFALGHEGIKSKFYGMPLVSVVWTYTVIQIFVGFIEMSVTVVSFRYGIVLNTVMLGFCLLGLIGTTIGKGEVEKLEPVIKEKVFYIKSLLADIEMLPAKVTDTVIKKQLKDLAETVRYSDPMSSPQLAALENKIENKVAQLVEATEMETNETIKVLCGEIQQLFAERNKKCKLLKG